MAFVTGKYFFSFCWGFFFFSTMSFTTNTLPSLSLDDDAGGPVFMLIVGIALWIGLFVAGCGRTKRDVRKTKEPLLGTYCSSGGSVVVDMFKIKITKHQPVVC